MWQGHCINKWHDAKLIMPYEYGRPSYARLGQPCEYDGTLIANPALRTIKHARIHQSWELKIGP